MTTRRQALTLGVAGAPLLAIGVSGCGPNASSGSGGTDAEPSLRITWWGNEQRAEITSQAISDYMASEPGTNITEEPSDWNAYWDKLATSAAGGDLPDIIQMSEAYLTEYGARGALLDLASAGLDTSRFGRGTVEVGEVPGEGLLAINAGVNAASVMVNPDVFEAAGVDLPDDTTWTWEDLMETAILISERTGEGVYGASPLGLTQEAFQVWTRQSGQDLFSEGSTGFDTNVAAEFFSYGIAMQETGAAPGASLAVEDISQSIEQQMFARGSTGIAFVWSNLAVVLDQAIGGRGKILRPPTMTGDASDAQLWYRAAMYWAVSSSTEHPEAAVAIVDYLVNNVNAAKVLGAERGIPGNMDCRSAIEGDLSPSEQKLVDYLNTIEPELGAVSEVYPVGGSDVALLIRRHGEDVLFGRSTAEASAAALYEELSNNLS